MYDETPCDKPTSTIYLDGDGLFRMRLCVYHAAKFQERIDDPRRYMAPVGRMLQLPCSYKMVPHEVEDWEAAHCTLPMWAFG